MRTPSFAMLSFILGFILTVMPAVANAKTFSKLASIESLDVELYQKPLLQDNVIPMETPRAIVDHLSKNPVLPYHSPSDAVLLLECQGFNCRSVQARIVLRSTGGEQGEAIWKRRYMNVITPPGLDRFWLLTNDIRRSGKSLGDKIAKDLLRDYQASRQASIATSSSKRIEP